MQIMGTRCSDEDGFNSDNKNNFSTNNSPVIVKTGNNPSDLVNK